MGHPEKSADGRKENGRREFLTQQRRREIDVGNVDEHTLAKGQPIERQAIATQRRFRICAARQVIPKFARELLPRGIDDFLQRHEFLMLRAGERTGLLLLSFIACHGFLGSWTNPCQLGKREGSSAFVRGLPE
jgi:hypothetical protein